MTHRLKFFLGCSIAGAVALTSVTASAGPTLIKDRRVRDLTSTPVLGRGYSISTNTFQSTCLKDVVVTEPSYDFQYSFVSEEEHSKSKSTSQSKTGLSLSYYWVSATVDASHKSATDRSKSVKNIIVTLNMDSYYASVDESGTPLSTDAAALLDREDLPGFFASCGPYYVRGINRNAQFVSLFTFEQTTDSADSAYAASLEANVKGWFSGSFGVKASHSSTFHRESSSRNLTITTRGWGLGKNEDASLISYDLPSFKAAIKQAFISMQNPLTGRVTSIEVVPWVENTGFQRHVNLRASDTGKDGDEVPLYEKKDTLNRNAEFLAEMERASRNLLNNYYKAKVCREDIIQRFTSSKSRKGPNPALRASAKKLAALNHRSGAENPTKPLGEVYKVLMSNNVEALWTKYSTLSYGGKSKFKKGEKTMRGCIKALMNGHPQPGEKVIAGSGRGIFTVRYDEHPECVGLPKKFANLLDSTIDDFCVVEVIAP